jgi:hypothetical protein
MENKNVKKKASKLSFIERAHYIPKTYRYVESFLESRNKVYDY